jgi:putative ATP-dependent endonuclease of OLD family
MHLTRVRLENFRCHRLATEVEIDSLTALIGRNDAGKSSILEAMQIFFDGSAPDRDDVTKSSDSEDCLIACEFDDFPPSIVIDAATPTTLESEHLLNVRGRLEIVKVYNCGLAKPKLKTIFARAMHPSANKATDLLILKNAELKKRAIELGVDTSLIDLKVNSQIRHTLWKSYEDLQLTEQDVPLTGDDARKVWEQLERAMPLFQLFKSDRASTDQDEEAQDPMRLAVRDAVKAQQAELDKVTEHVQQQVQAIAKRTVEKIREMDPALASQLNPKFSEPKWDTVFKISLTGDEDIPINKRGSGVRRLILLNFFRAQAERQVADKNASGVIYAIEEPETCQHPNSQRMLMNAFLELSERQGCQVLMTTHNPSLARLLPTSSLRYVSCNDDGSRQVVPGDAAAEIVAKALDILADHNVRLFVGVEGANDIEFLKAIAGALRKDDDSLPDLEKLEQSGELVFIPVGGSNLSLWTSRLANLNRPEVHIYDRDTQPPKQPACHKAVDTLNKRSECRAYVTHGITIENYLHPKAIQAVRAGVEITYGLYDNVPSLVAKAIHDESDSGTAWEELESKARHDKLARAKKWLNREAAACMSAELLRESDPTGDVSMWLTIIGQALDTGEFLPSSASI